MQRSHDRCNGEGMGEEVANSHMTVGGGGGGGGGGKGPVGLPLWARRALYSKPARPVILGPFDPPSGPVRRAQYKARRLAAGLKKKLIFGPARPVDCQQAYRPGPNRAACLT